MNVGEGLPFKQDLVVIVGGEVTPVVPGRAELEPRNR
jgi:hypothetical protein